MSGRRVEVNDRMQQGYVYELPEPAGGNFHPDFEPQLTPKQMLELGVFGGKYHDRLHRRVSQVPVRERQAVLHWAYDSRNI